MKKTLYQILGIDPKATQSEIEAAYIARIDELKFATLQDPNKLRVLQQSKEILSDPNQRATYDASIAPGAAPEPIPQAPAEQPAAGASWGKWIGAGAVLILALVWWSRHSATPPVPPAAQAPARVAPAPSAPSTPSAPAPSEAPVQKDAPATAPPAPTAAAETAAAADPLAGDWSCEDALTGHTSRYSFQNNGVLSIATSDGQLLDFKYERELRTLKLTDATAARAFAIEELTTRKMILNLGAGGQRVVCKR